MPAIAFCCNALAGYGARNKARGALLLLVSPIVVAISCFLIADIDSPRAGVIRVRAQNLHSLLSELRAS